MKLTKKMMNAGSGIYIVADDAAERAGDTILRWLSTGHFAIRADALPSADMEAVLAGEMAVKARWGSCETRNMPEAFIPPETTMKLKRTGWTYNGSKQNSRQFKSAGVVDKPGEVFANELYQAMLPDEPVVGVKDDGWPDADSPLFNAAHEPTIILMPTKAG